MHGEKATPAKEDKRANSPHPKAKPKAKAATTILIENDVECTFGPPKIETADEEVVIASIREEQLKSCLKGTTTEKKKKELKFSNRVGFVDIEVNKDMKPVGRDQRVYRKQYESSEKCPQSTESSARHAEAAARQLVDIIELFQKQVQPKCKFECKWLDCRMCRRLLKRLNAQAEWNSRSDEKEQTSTPMPKTHGYVVVDRRFRERNRRSREGRSRRGECQEQSNEQEGGQPDYGERKNYFVKGRQT